jgi:hypothetical protein
MAESAAYIADMSCDDPKPARHRLRQAETRKCERLSPGALRARRSRADRRNGVRTFRVRVHMRRIVAALRAAHRISDPDVDQQDIGRAVEQLIGDFCQRWLGPAR